MGLLKSGYKVFEHEALAILESYPKQKLEFTEKGVPCLIGHLDLVDKDGFLVDTYRINIEATELYPYRFPYLFETEGRIPKNIDWHVFETDGHCCICTIPDELLKCKKGVSLVQFIEDEVKPYLFNQTHRRIRGYFLNERSHGDDGEFQHYYTHFRTKDLKKIVDWLLFISQKKAPGRTNLCFCGSGEKYRYCHRDAFITYSVLDKEDILNLIDRIILSKQFKIALLQAKIKELLTT